MERGHITGKPTVVDSLTALRASYKDNPKAQNMLTFAALMQQTREIGKLVRAGAPAELVNALLRDTTASLGAFTMENLGYSLEEYLPIEKAFEEALFKDFHETVEVRALDEAAGNKTLN